MAWYYDLFKSKSDESETSDEDPREDSPDEGDVKFEEESYESRLSQYEVTLGKTGKIYHPNDYEFGPDSITLFFKEVADDPMYLEIFKRTKQITIPFSESGEITIEEEPEKEETYIVSGERKYKYYKSKGWTSNYSYRNISVEKKDS